MKRARVNDGAPGEKGRSLLAQGSSLGIFTLVSRVLGLIREMVKAAYLGTGPVSDAFSVAFLIPNLFRRLFAENSMTVAFIPTFRDYVERADEAETREFLNASFTLLVFLVGMTTGLGMLFTPWLVPIFGTSTGETVILTRIMFPYLAVISIAAFFQGILNGVKIFNPSGFTPILFNIFVVGTTMIMSPRMANPGRAMALGVIIGGSVQAAFQLPYVLRRCYRFGFTSLRRAFANPGTRTVLRLIGPTILGMAAYQINDIVSTALAGQAGTGVVSSLQYSLRLQELILGIFAVTIGTVILPGLSSFASRRDWSSFYARLEQAIRAIALITIPVAGFSWLFGEEIIALLFLGGDFDGESLRLTLGAFNWHIAGLFFIALNRILSPAYYAQKDSLSPTLAGLLNFGVNISIAALLVGPMKGAGIALALSIASAVNTLALLFMFRRKTEAPALRLGLLVLGYGLRMALLTALAALPLWFLGPGLFDLFAGLGQGPGKLGSLGLPILILSLLYALLGGGLLLVTRDPLAMGLLRRLKRGRKEAAGGGAGGSEGAGLDDAGSAGSAKGGTAGNDGSGGEV